VAWVGRGGETTGQQARGEMGGGGSWWLHPHRSFQPPPSSIFVVFIPSTRLIPSSRSARVKPCTQRPSSSPVSDFPSSSTLASDAFFPLVHPAPPDEDTLFPRITSIALDLTSICTTWYVGCPEWSSEQHTLRSLGAGGRCLTERRRHDHNADACSCCLQGQTLSEPG
jgi:hypothetical protein